MNDLMQMSVNVGSSGINSITYMYIYINNI